MNQYFCCAKGLLLFCLLLVSFAFTQSRQALAQNQTSAIQKISAPNAVDSNPSLQANNSENSRSSDSFLAPSRKGLFSLGLTFGAQSGPYGRESAGFRFGLFDALWTGFFVQASINEKAKEQAYGVHVELGVDLFKRGRAILSLVPVFAYGKSSKIETKETISQWGALLGLQLEVFLVREVSTALKIDFGGQVEPADEMLLSTASSELMLFCHL